MATLAEKIKAIIRRLFQRIAALFQRHPNKGRILISFGEWLNKVK